MCRIQLYLLLVITTHFIEYFIILIFNILMHSAGTNLFIAGAVARGASVLVMYPLDTLKTRLQVEQIYSCTHHLVHENILIRIHS